MRKKRRFLWMAVVCCLCAALVVSALAENAAGLLYRAGTALLFDTDNAELNLRASFTCNGSPFKTMDALYRQDGTNSLMQIKLKTPRLNGTEKESGFTVVANGETSYSIDPVDNPLVYNTSHCAASSSILSASVLRRTLLRLGGLALDAVGSQMDGFITAEVSKDGTSYHVQLKAGDTPNLVDTVATLAVQAAAHRYFYIDYDYLTQAEQTEDENGVDIIFEDYYENMAACYQRLYGEKMPENFYEILWSEGDESEQAMKRYDEIQNTLTEELEVPLRESYDHGVAYIHTDDSVTYYETSDQYYVANNLQMVDFADYETTFRNFYQKETGQELTVQQMNALYCSNNMALAEAYEAMYERMMKEYLDLVQADGKASLIYVHADGSYHMVYDFDAYIRSQYYDSRTVTRRLLETMSSLEIGDCDFTVTLDQQGRITGGSGTASIVFIDLENQRNLVEISFDTSVGGYGETQVKEFDPADYGVMDWEAFRKLEVQEGDEPVEEQVPETILFDGVQYQVVLEEEQE